MASTGRAAPSSPGPRHSSPPRPPSFPPSDKSGLQRELLAPGRPQLLWEHVQRVPRCCCCDPDPPRTFLPLRGETSVQGGGLGASRLLLKSRGCFGRVPALCAAGGDVQLSHSAGRAGAAILFAQSQGASFQESCPSFPGYQPGLSSASRFPGSLSEADECVCDSPVPRAGSASDSQVPCEGEMPHSCEHPPHCCYFIFPWLYAVFTSLGRQQGSPHPFPADSPTPGGCPVAVPGLCLVGSDSRGKLCLSGEGAKELPSGGVSSEVTSSGLFPSGQQPAGESVVCACRVDVLTHQPGAFAPSPVLTELLQFLCPLASLLCHPWDCVHRTVRSFECLPIQSFTLSPGKVASAVVPWEQSTSLLLCQCWDHLLPALLQTSQPGATAQVRMEKPAWRLSHWRPPDPWLEQSGCFNQRNLVSFEICWLRLF